jgi:hypothetical protein
MKQSSKTTPRKFSTLSDSGHRQLYCYALAATATGVSTLALTRHADARIIYTKTDAVVFNTQGYPLDLNHDGITDFRFLGYSTGTDCVNSVGLKIDQASSANKIRQKSGGAAALRAGVVVGPKGAFSGNLSMGKVSSACSGPVYHGLWENNGKGVENRYLGLKFKIKGKNHFGWARLSFTYPSAATMTGYAYETVPNKPIITGKTKGSDVIDVEPGSLGALAAGRR